MEKKEEKQATGATSDDGKSDSDRPLKPDHVFLSPFAAVGRRSKLEETHSGDGESFVVDCFYERLTKLCESSGVPLLEGTKLDLYKLYKEVIERGGLHKVLKDGKWDEVTSSFNASTGKVKMKASDLIKIYSNILYNYEKIYHYRSSKEDSKTEGKRKYSEFSCLPVSNHYMTTDAAIKKENSPKIPEEKLRRSKDAPKSARNAYQMYLKIECFRLKKMHNDGEDKISGSLNFRDIAIKSWRDLSKADREPYEEESKKDKQRFNEEMAAYLESKNNNMTENITVKKKTSSSLHQQNQDKCLMNLESASNESTAAEDIDSAIKMVQQ